MTITMINETKIKSLSLTKDLYEYILKMNPKENPYLEALRIETDKLKYSRLRSPTEQIHFITFLLSLLKPKNILEIGTFTGYSTLAMGLATPPTTKIITCDINNVFPEIGKTYWENAGMEKRIQLLLGPAKKTIANLQTESKTFDFIFIDADKENYWDYFQSSLNMLNHNGVIMIDNVLWHGQIIDHETDDIRAIAIRDFNQRLSQQTNINFCLLPIGDGITLVTKKDDNI
jgi:predicted O-methyltransferase YrrM